MFRGLLQALLFVKGVIFLFLGFPVGHFKGVFAPMGLLFRRPFRSSSNRKMFFSRNLRHEADEIRMWDGSNVE